MCFCCFLLLVGGALAVGVAAAEAESELALVNARVVTMDEDQPSAEAILMRGETIVAAGSSQHIRDLAAPDAEVIDAAGRTVLPGFNDAHLHPEPVHPPLSRLGVVPCGPEQVRSLAELVAALQEKAKVTPRGEWIIGSGYQDTKLGRHPNRIDLDRASTAHPIYLTHSSGHVAAVNSLALGLAGISSRTADPRGGAFDRDATGTPTGVCREQAKSIVRQAGPPRPQPTTKETVEGYLRCFAEYVRQGITSVQVAGADPELVRILRLLPVRDQPVRVYVMLRNEFLEELRQMRDASGLGDHQLRLGGVKRWFGNSLSGRTCWLYEPYADRPDYYGIPPRDSQAEIDARVLEIHAAGFQACIHANGDREIDMLLDAFEKALDEAPRDNHRHRIEHCSVVNARILGRIKELGLVLAPHSYVYEHGDKMEAYGADRWEWMHPNRSAIEMGIPVAGNSDSPVSAARPLLRIQSMVTRRSAEGKVYGASQRVTVQQALAAWTLGGAFASFEEDLKGSLTVGKLADVVVLSQDPRAVAEDAIKDIQVDYTIIGGKVCYDRLRQTSSVNE